MTKYFIHFLLLFLPFLGISQHTALLQNLKDSIQINAKLMAESEGEMQLQYSEKLSFYITKFIKQEKSIEVNMDSMEVVKVLTSKDQKLRIFTWVIPLGDGEFLFKGLSQSYINSHKEYKISEFTDQTQRLSRAYNRTLSADKWYGAYYYKIIQTSRGSKVFYTLLGWKGVDKTTQAKLVEVVTLRSNGELIFGYGLFNLQGYEYFEKTKSPKRLIFEYSAIGSMYLNYDYQTIVVKTAKKSKKKKNKNVRPGFNAQAKLSSDKEKVKTFSDNLIVMDRLVPTSMELTEFYEFYYPESNIIDALRFERNVWKYYPDIDARNAATPKPKGKKNVQYDLVPK